MRNTTLLEHEHWSTAMRDLKVALMLAAGLAVTTASAQVTLKLVNTQDVSILCDTLNPDFFIGNNPSAVCLVGDRLFVGGYNNSGLAADLKLVVIEDIFGARQFRVMAIGTDTEGNAIFNQNMPAQRNYTGFDYAPGHGLLVNWDRGGVGVASQIRLFDIDTQLNPILLQEAVPSQSPAGGGGPAWDFGFDGLGFDTNGDGQKDSPLAAIVDFRGYPNSLQNFGPIAYRVTDDLDLGLNALSYSSGVVYSSDMTDGGDPARSIAPNIGNLPGGARRAGDNGVTNDSLLWRDIDIHPTSGFVAARANDVLLGNRDEFNGVDIFNIADAGTQTPNLQNLQIVYNLPCGEDFVIYNSRANGGGAGQAFEATVLGTDYVGNPVTLSFVEADGVTPAIIPTGVSAYDFSWDPATQRLAISDFANRNVYIFEVACPSVCPECAADFDQDGGVTGSDVEAFFIEFEAGTTCADVDLDGGVTGSDVEFFFTVFEAGGC